MHWLRYAVLVPSMIPLEVLLEMKLEFSIGIRRAGYSIQRWLSAAWTELLIEVLGNLKAGMASEYESLQMLHPCHCGRE
jgi:hypothetical protein